MTTATFQFSHSVTLNGAVHDNWSDPANWSTGAVPVSSSDVVIPTVPSGAHGNPYDNIATLTVHTITLNSGMEVGPGDTLTSGAFSGTGSISLDAGAELNETGHSASFVNLVGSGAILDDQSSPSGYVTFTSGQSGTFYLGQAADPGHRRPDHPQFRRRPTDLHRADRQRVAHPQRSADGRFYAEFRLHHLGHSEDREQRHHRLLVYEFPGQHRQQLPGGRDLGY